MVWAKPYSPGKEDLKIKNFSISKSTKIEKNLVLKDGQKNPCATTCPPLLMDSPTNILTVESLKKFLADYFLLNRRKCNS